MGMVPNTVPITMVAMRVFNKATY